MRKEGRLQSAVVGAATGIGVRRLPPQNGRFDPSKRVPSLGAPRGKGSGSEACWDGAGGGGPTLTINGGTSFRGARP